jgi:protein-disulfide isomerase
MCDALATMSLVTRTVVIATVTLVLAAGAVGGVRLALHQRRVDRLRGMLLPAAAVPRLAVPLQQSPTLGAPDALVTVVEFGDLECAACRGTHRLRRGALRRFRGRLRWVYKHFPLPVHAQAHLAARAAWVAQQQGRFWTFLAAAAAERRPLELEVLGETATRAGLERERALQGFSDSEAANAVAQDIALGRRLGVDGTPTFFINGRRQGGALPVEVFDELLTDELNYAQQLVKSGLPRGELYRLLGDGVSIPPETPQPGIAKVAGLDGQRYRVERGDGLLFGPSWALVTVVAFVDYQCRHSIDLLRNLQILARADPGLAIYVRHFPLQSHPQAQFVAESVLAARAQDRLLAFHEQLLQAPSGLPREELDRLASRAGLQPGPFQAALRTRRFAAAVRLDSADAVRFGAIGTPTYFVNGRYYRGTKPMTELKRIIAAARPEAQAKLDAGVLREQLYQAVIEDVAADAR